MRRRKDDQVHPVVVQQLYRIYVKFVGRCKLFEILIFFPSASVIQELGDVALLVLVLLFRGCPWVRSLRCMLALQSCANSRGAHLLCHMRQLMSKQSLAFVGS